MKIILAEKDPELLSLITARLISRNYEVVEFSASENVLKYLDREYADLMLMSTEMERVHGKHLIECIRERHHLSDLPIVMMAEETQISELIMSHDQGFDDFLIKPFSPLVLQLRVAINITKTKTRAEANALTKLPGNHTIEKVIRERIEKGDTFSVLYIDINHFKSFNDRYSFEKGDDVLRQTAKLLLQTKERVCRGAFCFVGHIGGDDFLVVLTPDMEAGYAEEFMREFDRLMPTYYNETDQKKGQVQVSNRQGKNEYFPLMSCSIAACTNLYRPYKNLGEIAHDAAEVKTFLKSQPGSNYLRDRRAEPIKQLDEAAKLFTPVKSNKKKRRKKENRQLAEPLGQILLNAGLINQTQLSKAIKRHMITGQRLGQTLISMKLVQSEDVGRMLEKKLNIPYVSLTNYQPAQELLRMFTHDFMKSHRAIPLEIVGQKLKLGMCDPFDLKVLDSIERISGLKPVPCLALEDEFEGFVESLPEENAQEEKAS